MSSVFSNSCSCSNQMWSPPKMSWTLQIHSIDDVSNYSVAVVWVIDYCCCTLSALRRHGPAYSAVLRCAVCAGVLERCVGLLCWRPLSSWFGLSSDSVTAGVKSFKTASDFL